MNGIIQKDIDIINNHFGNVISEMKNSTVLITGACGMITSYLAYVLINNADEINLQIYLQCRNINKAEKIYSDYKDNSRVHIIDMPLDKTIETQINYDYIIHGASLAGTEHFLNNPVGVISPNVLGVYNLLEYSRKNNIKKFLFLSSTLIYGVSNKMQLDEGTYGEVDPLGERACYIESKRMGETFCSAYTKQFATRTGIIRMSHTYGPTFDIQRDNRAIPRSIRNMIQGEDIVLYRDPDSVLQYIYAADIASAILFVLCKGNEGEAYNACGNELITMEKALSFMIAADDSIKSSLIEKPIDENYAFGRGKGINYSKVDNKKLQSLGWKPLFSAEEGFARTIKSYLY